VAGLNFVWRGHDFACVVVLMAVAVVWWEWDGVWGGVKGGVWGVLHEYAMQKVGE